MAKDGNMFRGTESQNDLKVNKWNGIWWCRVRGHFLVSLIAMVVESRWQVVSSCRRRLGHLYDRMHVICLSLQPVGPSNYGY
jgi:hypothetical protein